MVMLYILYKGRNHYIKMATAFSTVLDAYNEAYPSHLTMVANSADAKYYPSETFNTKKIDQDIVNANGDKARVEAIRKEAPLTTPKTVAFVPFEGKGSWGFFQEKDVQDFVKRNNDNMTINFKTIQELPTAVAKKVAFHRALTMIYGKKSDDNPNIIFFDPFDHIEKADSLKKTVDIMIRSKNTARSAGSS